MKYDPQMHHRRSIRLKNYDYSQPGYYFLTMCSHNRENAFGEISEGGMIPNEFGTIVQSYWNELPKRYPGSETVTFMVMPNHVHGIINITVGPVNFDNVGAIHDDAVGAIHDVVAGAIHDDVAGAVHDDVVGAIHESPLQRRRNMLIPKMVGWFKMNTAKCINKIRQTPALPVWQRGYWEHVIRNEESFNRIFEYIASNPLCWHLDRNNPNREGEDEFDMWLDGL